jgi:hypothetical protein
MCGQDRRIDRLGRAMLHYVGRAMLSDFRLGDLERFCGCASRQYGKHNAQRDRWFEHRMTPTNFHPA